MGSPDQSPLDDIGLGVEIDMITAELCTMDTVIADYPKLTAIFQKAKDELLRDPSAFFAHRAESMRVARENFPALYKLMVEDDAGDSEST